MTSFLVVGDGFAATKVALAVAALPNARLAGVAGSTPPAGGFLDTPGGERVEAVDTQLLTQEAGAAWARASGAAWILCINSTVILPARLLEIFEGRALNAHPGPLPEYGGLHAHQWAIRHGAAEYGSTVHRMEARLDAGPIVAATRYAIEDSDTGLSLFRRAIADAAELLIDVARKIAAKEELAFVPQDASRRRIYAHREALDGRMDWRLPARALVDFVRAGNYEPFRSPTYVATMAAPSGAAIEVLRCKACGETDSSAGALVALRDDGPLIAAGDGRAVQILRARAEAKLLDAAAWRRHFG